MKTDLNLWVVHPGFHGAFHCFRMLQVIWRSGGEAVRKIWFLRVKPVFNQKNCDFTMAMCGFIGVYWIQIDTFYFCPWFSSLTWWIRRKNPTAAKQPWFSIAMFGFEGIHTCDAVRLRPLRLNQRLGVFLGLMVLLESGEAVVCWGSEFVAPKNGWNWKTCCHSYGHKGDKKKGEARGVFCQHFFCQGIQLLISFQVVYFSGWYEWYGWHANPVVQISQWTSPEICKNPFLQSARSLKHWTPFNECCPLERPKSSTNGFDNLSVLVGVWLNAHSFFEITKRCILFLIMNSLPICRRFTQKYTFASLAKLQKCLPQLRLYLPPNTSQNEARKIHLQKFQKIHQHFSWLSWVGSKLLEVETLHLDGDVVCHSEKIFDGDVDPPKSRDGNSLRVLWSELRVSLLPTQKAMGVAVNLHQFTVFGVWKISFELISKAVEQNQFNMRLHDTKWH